MAVEQCMIGIPKGTKLGSLPWLKFPEFETLIDHVEWDNA
jgi:hypothetical protein